MEIRFRSLLLVMTLSIWGNFAFAEDVAPPKNLNTVQNGGALLEYPRGRFQENTPPDFFKWSLVRPAHSVSLKIFRTNQEGQFDPSKDMITRYDFLSKIQSATWTRDSFPKGEYAWTIETYDDSSAVPTHIDTAKFVVEPLKHYDVQTLRMGSVVGFSRGKYSSKYKDATGQTDISYDTTPTTYGLTSAGGDEKRTWNITGYISDFILQGGVQRTMNLLGGYYFRMGKINRFGTEIYAGPTVRIFDFPRVTSPSSTVIDTKATVVVNPGGAVIIQKRFDLHVTLYSQFNADLPVFGTSRVDASLNQINYSAHAGMIYGLFWPIGFSGEIQYRTDRAATYDGHVKIKSELQEWGVVATLLYAF